MFHKETTAQQIKGVQQTQYNMRNFHVLLEMLLFQKAGKTTRCTYILSP